VRVEDLRDLTDDELVERIQELKEERFRLGFRAATMELENPSLPRILKRQIAQTMTILHERRSAAAAGQES